MAQMMDVESLDESVGVCNALCAAAQLPAPIAVLNRDATAQKSFRASVLALIADGRCPLSVDCVSKGVCGGADDKFNTTVTCVSLWCARCPPRPP
jgi:hypothetical protein